jgi:hypothetical protein
MIIIEKRFVEFSGDLVVVFGYYYSSEEHIMCFFHVCSAFQQKRSCRLCQITDERNVIKFSVTITVLELSPY